MKRFLENLRKFNTLALASYLIYFIVDYQDFFHSKEQSGIIIVGLFMFFTTFICGTITLSYADKKSIDTSASFKDILQFKPQLIFWGIICLIEIAILLIFHNNDRIFWCIGCLVISYSFTIMERIVVPKIEESKTYKITLPFYIYPIPFVFFFVAEIYAFNHLSEEAMNTVGMLIFVIAGIMMAYLVWHSYYEVDEQLKRIEKSYGFFDIFKNQKSFVNLDDIKYYKKIGLYYYIYTDYTTMKINRFYSGTKRLEKTFEEYGIRKNEL